MHNLIGSARGVGRALHSPNVWSAERERWLERPKLHVRQSSNQR